MHKSQDKSYHKTEIIGNAKIKVTVHIPENVRDRQERINRIYNILKPARSEKTA